MKFYKPLTTAFISAIMLVGCSSRSSQNVNVDGDDMKYTIDPENGYCFSYTGSQKLQSLNTTGLGIAKVEGLPDTLLMVPINELKELKENGKLPHISGRDYLSQSEFDRVLTELEARNKAHELEMQLSTARGRVQHRRESRHPAP